MVITDPHVPAGGEVPLDEHRGVGPAVFSAVMSTMSEGALVEDPDGTIVFANPAASALLGVGDDGLLGAPLASLVQPLRPDGEPMAAAELPGEVARRTGLPVRDVLLGIPTDDGDARWTMVSAAPVLASSDDGPVVRVISTWRDVTDELANENALRCLESIVESTGDAIFTTTVDGEIVSWNAGARDVFGFSAVQIEGSSFRVLFPALPGEVFRLAGTVDDVAVAMAHADADAVLDLGLAGAVDHPATRVEDVVTSAIRRDGASILVSIAVSPVRDPGGQVIGFSVIARDISEPTRTTELLRRSEQRLAALFRNVTSVVLVVGADGSVSWVSESIEGLTGFPASHYLDRRLHEGLEIDGRTLARIPNGTPAPDAPLVIEIRIRHRDGGWRWIEMSRVDLLDDPSVAGVVVNLHDITERREALDEVTASERRFRQIVETTQEGIWTADAGGRTTLVNEAMAGMLGHAPEEMIGVPIEAFLPPEQRELGNKRFERVLAGRSDRFELVLIRKDGSEIVASVSLSPIWNGSAEGPVAGVMAMMTDVTDARVRAAQQAAVARLAWSALRDQPLAVLCDEAVAEVADVLQVDAAGVFLPEAATRSDAIGAARLSHGAGWLHGLTSEVTLQPSACRALESAAVGEAVIFTGADAPAGGLIDPFLTRGSGPDVRTGAALRIDGDDHCYGVVAVCSGPARTFSEDDENFMGAVAAIIGSAFARHQTNDALVLAEEAERLRLSEGIHDDHLQVMAAVALRLEAFGRTHLEGSERQSLDVLVGDVRLAAERLRNLVFDLVPEEVDEHNLADLVRRVLDHASEDANFTFDFDASLQSSLPEAVGVVVLRTAQEAIVNIRKHAHASHVQVRLESHDDITRVRISDNGVGIAPGDLGQSDPGHIGISSMRKRVRRMGGEWEISSDLGVGTVVTFFVPHSSSPAELVDGGGRSILGSAPAPAAPASAATAATSATW
jgi:PAS domain S-box-containing protein